MIKKFSIKHPIIRPFMRSAKKIIPMVPLFSGCGMKTEHDVPWNNLFTEKEFIDASNDIKKNFQFTESEGVNSKNIDELLWKHWNVSFAIRYIARFVKTTKFNFCECGVAEGMSAFFALKEICVNNRIGKNFSMHLYDAWDAMKKENLLVSELSNVGRYAQLDINVTKKNLFEFKENLTFHQGYIPDSFQQPPDPPKSIVYLHIDLNSSKPTRSALEFFYPRLVSGGIILFDDYGWIGYEDTRKIVDEFFDDKAGILFTSPTGQAIYFHK